MKTCSKCDISYTDDKKFCKKCGSPLVAEYNIEPKEVAKKSVYEDRLKADPLNIEILQEYAQFLFDNLLFNESVSISLKILAINEKDFIAKELLFKAYLKLNKFKESIDIGEQLLSENPEDIFLLENLAKISRGQNNNNKALEYYEKILSIQPINSTVLHEKALILLEKNQIEEAISIFKKLKADEQNDRITVIYDSIDKVLNADYKNAIDSLSSILSSYDVTVKDNNSNRGLLYLAYSLSISNVEISEINRWFLLIDFELLRKSNVSIDNKIIINTVTSIITNELGKIKPPGNESLKYNIEILIRDYLNTTIYFFNNNSKEIADLWYNIALKYEELTLFKEAQSSYKKALDIIPDNNNYKEKYEKFKAIQDKQTQAAKRKIKVAISVVIISIIVIIVSVFAYNNFKENRALVRENNDWEQAKQINTPSSIQKYLNEYPNGKFIHEADSLQKIAFYRIKDKDPIGFADFILKKGLIAYYPLFNNAKDSTGNQNNITLQSNPIPNEGTYCRGVYSGDRNLNTGTGYLSFFNVKSFTISVQFKVLSNIRQWVFVLGESGRLIGFKLERNGFITMTANNQDIEVPTNEKYSLNTWQIATITYINDTAKIYLNKKQIGCYAIILDSDEKYSDGNYRVTTVNYSNGVAFKGWIKNLRIYNRTLNSLDIFTLYKESIRKNEIEGEPESVSDQEAFISASMPAFICDPDGYTNIRQNRDKNSPIVGTINVNEEITVLDNNGDWWKVQKADGVNGFVHKSRIIMTENSCEITGDAVRFRATPDLNGKIITKFRKGTKVEVLEKRDAWVRVRYVDKIGYVSEDFITK